MRDSQSLFDQLLAFSDGQITAGDVHRLLGTASDDRLIGLVAALIDRQAASALKQLEESLAEGVQLGEFVDQVLRYLRDVMVVAAGAEVVGLGSVSADHRPTVEAHAKAWGLNTVMAALQILSETRSQMARVTYGRVLAELALVRISLLENLEELQQVVKALTRTNGKLTLPIANSAPVSSSPPEAKTAPPEIPEPQKKTKALNNHCQQP
jgi:DNA polymerase-3 subunit gamma/tau